MKLKRPTILALCAIIFLLTTTMWLLWHYTLLNIQIAFAAEQSQIFEETRNKALSTSIRGEAVRYLEYIDDYYPSGTKQDVGSLLDEIVEHNRDIAKRDIVAHLRATTGKDFGNDPKNWIKKFK